MALSKNLKAAKRKADKTFSEFIRRSYANKEGYCTCVSCGAIKHWKEMDCGHWHSRRFIATRWDEDNCFPQCRYCNRFIEGNKPGYSEFMTRRYGECCLQELSKLAHSVLRLTASDVDEITDKYKKKLKEL